MDYPKTVVIKMPSGAEVTVSCSGGEIVLVYDCGGVKTRYRVKETQNNKLIMNK